MIDNSSIAARVGRARSDKVATLIKAATERGITFISDGDLLEMQGLERLSTDDTALLLANLPAVRARLIVEDAHDPEVILDQLDIDLEEVVDAELARAAIATLAGHDRTRSGDLRAI